MSVKKIVRYGEESLREPSKEVTRISTKVKKLVEDLLDTMYARNGVGLAAPQIGVNLRVFVVDVNIENQVPNPMVFINPKIIEKSGAVNSFEGCLSFPNAYTDVRRYKNIKVKAMNLQGRYFILEARDGSLLSRCIQHENDHLDGVLFVDHARSTEIANKELKEKGLDLINPEFYKNEVELEEEILKEPKPVPVED